MKLTKKTIVVDLLLYQILWMTAVYSAMKGIRSMFEEYFLAVATTPFGAVLVLIWSCVFVGLTKSAVIASVVYLVRLFKKGGIASNDTTITKETTDQ